VRPGDLVITDRGYCGREWFGRVQAAGADFLGRVPRGWHAAADALFAANAAGVSRTVELALKGRLRRVLRQAGFLQEVLRVRLVSLRLATGELEVLATSLLDERAYPTGAFGEVYGWRWGVEGFYGVLKGRLGLFYREAPAEEILAQLTRLMQLAPVAQRLQRPPPPRRAPSLCRSLNYLRLCVVRKTKAAIAVAQAKLRREATKNGSQLQPETLFYAQYVMVLTTFAEAAFSAGQVLEAYRYRWQIELDSYVLDRKHNPCRI
jgi:hypothetical protein